MWGTAAAVLVLWDHIMSSSITIGLLVSFSVCIRVKLRKKGFYKGAAVAQYCQVEQLYLITIYVRPDWQQPPWSLVGRLSKHA